MKTKELNAKVFPYILDCIDSEEYINSIYNPNNFNPKTDREKLQFLYNVFISEYWSRHKTYYKGNMIDCFKNWLMGLPSVFNVDFENYKILEIAIQWGSIPESASEKQKDKILKNWFNFIAVKTFQLLKKHKII